MGQVQVEYKRRRGANEAGTPVTKPKDWFTELIQDSENWTKIKNLYDNNAEARSEIDRILEDSRVMENQTNAGMWLNEVEDDEGYLQDKMNEIKQVME